MTRQEKKQELVALFATGAMPIGELIDECFAFADNHPHWISVEDDGLPTKDGCYLFCAEGEPVYMCYYYADFKMSRASHWMPLPSIETIKNKNYET